MSATLVSSSDSRRTGARALVIDDDPLMAACAAEVLETLGITATATTGPAEFFAALTPEVELVLLDLLMPELDGVELLRLMARRGSQAKVIVISGVGERVLETTHELAAALGLANVRCLNKPYRVAELAKLARGLLQPEESLPVSALPRRPCGEGDIDGVELERALEQNEFVPFFQPQIDLRSGTIAGMEALVRWRHPRLGLLAPARFLACMDRARLMDRLCWKVVRQSAAALGRMAGVSPVTPTLSINVAAQSLDDLSFPDTLVDILARLRVTPSQIVLEVTEGSLLGELSRSLDVLARLRMKGFLLSVDDYGTGYAMMQQLRRIPATELKIDRSFIERLPGSPSDRVMVRKTIEMGHALGMRVVAEGVETQAQLDVLLQDGCDLAQGYFFSPPLPECELMGWIAERAAA